jgi:MoaA/NifB/PqqE/SkfB family radical SAM enzyme
MHLIDPSVVFNKIFDNKKSRKYILSAGLELTTVCNFNCTHCYLKDWKQINISLTQWKFIVDLLAEAGCFSVYLTGGEPFLYPHFTDLYLYLKKKGFLISIFSNGTTLNKEYIDLFKKWPPKEIEISVYGISKNVFDIITGSKDLLPSLLNTIETLHSCKIPFNLKTIILKENIAEVPSIKEFADFYNVRFRTDPYITARRNGDTTPCSHRADPKNIALVERLDSRLSEFCDKTIQNIVSGKLDTTRTATSPFICNVERGNSVFIAASGEMAPCLELIPWAVPITNKGLILDRKSFWDNFYSRFKYPSKRISNCFLCDKRPICNICSIQAYFNKYDTENSVPFCCELSNARVAVSAENTLEVV